VTERQGRRNEPTQITATQAATVAVPWAGTSLSASGNLKHTGSMFSSTISFQRPLAPHLNFSVSLTDPQTLVPAGNLRVDYRVRW